MSDDENKGAGEGPSLNRGILDYAQAQRPRTRGVFLLLGGFVIVVGFSVMAWACYRGWVDASQLGAPGTPVPPALQGGSK